MVKVLAKNELTFENDVYFLKKEEETLLFEEVNGNGKEADEVFEVDLSEFFKNTEPWENGIKTPYWYMTFINALSFKVPNFVFEKHHNFLISVIPKETKSGKKAYVISGIVFAKEPNEALKNAFELKKINRSYISFEVSKKYSPYLLPITKTDLKVLFGQILKELKEIKEVAIKTYEETKKVKAITFQTVQISERVLEEILSLKVDTVARLNEIQLKLSLLEKKVSEIDDLKKKIENLENFNKEKPKNIVENLENFNKEKPKNIEVILISGVVNEKGEKIGLNPFGNIEDYVEPVMDSFLRHFGIVEEIEGLKEKLQQLIKQKFEKGETEITPKELKNLGLDTTTTTPWKITIRIKKEMLKKLINALTASLMGIPQKEVEKATKCFVKKAIQIKKFNPELLQECFDKRYHTRIKKFLKFVQNLSKGKELTEGKYFALDNALVAFALELEAKRRKQQIKLYKS